MTGATLYEVRDGIATITLNRPDQRNALSTDLVNSLGDHLAIARTDESCRVVLLTNAGPAFCAGADLKGSSTEQARWTLPEVLTTIIELPKPVVGRIAGHCMGGGVGLAAACDISIAADDVRFGFTEVRIGVAPAIISVVCLPKMRVGDALELFLSGERVEAARAVEVGLINRSVARESLDHSVASILAALLQGSPHALAAAKRLVYEVPGMAREAAFEWTARLSSELFAAADAREGRAAFGERRPPSWAPVVP
ncbi:MAG: enoyl-CoA hydratase/isomerase family protein [Acidimicrobiales bacterium]|jgi:methylglutaconyl-CoA hydratase